MGWLTVLGASISSRYVTSQLGQLSLVARSCLVLIIGKPPTEYYANEVGRLIEYQLRLGWRRECHLCRVAVNITTTTTTTTTVSTTTDESTTTATTTGSTTATTTITTPTTTTPPRTYRRSLALPAYTRGRGLLIRGTEVREGRRKGTDRKGSPQSHCEKNKHCVRTCAMNKFIATV